MRGRAGVVILVLGLFAAGLAAGAIKAGPTAPPGTTGDTTTQVTTTAETTTTLPPAPITTTAAPAATTTAAPPPPRNVIGAAPIGGGSCLLAAFALQSPDGETRVLGSTARTKHDVRAQSVAYPADASIVAAESASLHLAGCGKEGHAEVRSLSLFGGAVTARSVALAVAKNVSGSQIRIDGLEIKGKLTSLSPGRSAPVGSWGDAAAFSRAGGTDAAALAVHLAKAHSGLPAGTTLLVSFARVPQPQEKQQAPAPAPRTAAAPKTHTQTRTHTRVRAHAQRQTKTPKPKRKHRRRKRLGDDPLTITPPLGISRYVFPVAGESSYIDTYGGFRGDVPGNWHHGDDIFAAVGTPVVAVADGTLNRVGWQRLGGWRLWVRDHMRNEFYYAHLSGYSPLALHSRYVKAGDVIGFIGNTGDAFTTPPHLHFEIHPHQLLRLDYNGAANPTRYIDAWPHVAHPRTPTPAHPPFPHGPVRAEARYVWRELLAARGLISHAPKPNERPKIRVPRPDHALPGRRLAAAAPFRPDGGVDGVLLNVGFGLLAPALLFGAALIRVRRRPA